MSSGHDDHNKQHLVEATIGAAAELAKQGGAMQSGLSQQIYHAATHHNAGAVGAGVGRVVASAAPFVAVGAAAVAPIAVPIAAVGGAAYLTYQFVKWLCDD